MRECMMHWCPLKLKYLNPFYNLKFNLLFNLFHNLNLNLVYVWTHLERHFWDNQAYK